jgi:hypothetical protein
VIIIGTASLKAWQTKTLHSLLILASRCIDWTAIFFPQTALTPIVHSNGRTLHSLPGAN